MPSFEEIPLDKLPESLLEDVSRYLARFSVGFVRVEDTATNLDATLLGSGTAVSIGTARGVLTAHHVIEVLPKTGRLGLILGPERQRHTINVQGLTYLKIARGSNDPNGPDLGGVLLAPSIAGDIEARKVFYNLDARREEMLSNPPDLQTGVWFVNGFVAERTVEERSDERELLKGFYNLSGAGFPNAPVSAAGYDYYEFPVDYDGRSVAPRSFGGMSGGGLWQVRLVRNHGGELTHDAHLFSGVVFYQDPATDTSTRVRCHGRHSVYRIAYDAIAASSSGQ